MVTKVTINLPDEIAEKLQELAKSNNATVSSTVAQSIVLNKFLTTEEKSGAKILIESPDKTIKQIVR